MLLVFGGALRLLALLVLLAGEAGGSAEPGDAGGSCLSWGGDVVADEGSLLSLFVRLFRDEFATEEDPFRLLLLLLDCKMKNQRSV